MVLEQAAVRPVEIAEAAWRFTRPHTIVGTTISVCSVTAMAMNATHATGWSGAMTVSLGATLWTLVQALIPALLMNVAIVGLNQVYDKRIDRINKPYLPMASGRFTSNVGVSLVSGCAGLGLAAAALTGSTPLMWTLVSSLLLGILYSVDVAFLRWKRSALLAAGCILTVRAIIVQGGFYFHALGGWGGWAAALDSVGLMFATCFMGVYSVVIALFKDLPDYVGDAQHDVRTLSVQLGRATVFNLNVALLLLAYAGGVAVAAFCTSSATNAAVVGAGHLLAGVAVAVKCRGVDTNCSASLYEFYMFIWKLFYLEYLMFPFIY